MNCQIVHDLIHVRSGWTETYLIHIDGPAVGFASVAIGGPWKENRTVLECYVLPEYRTRAFEMFEAVLGTVDCKSMEVQSNDSLVTVMLHTFARQITTEKIVFRDAFDISIGILGTAGLEVGLNGNITNLTFASTAGSALNPNYSIPGDFTLAWTGALTARLVNVPLIGTINLGTLGASLSGTQVLSGAVPGTMTLSDLQGGAGPFPNDMLASLAAALAASAPVTVSAPIISDQTWTVPEGKDGFSSLRIRGNMNITLNLSLSHNLNGTVQNALVPEPGSIVLMAIGVGGVIAVGYRRKHRESH